MGDLLEGAGRGMLRQFPPPELQQEILQGWHNQAFLGRRHEGRLCFIPVNVRALPVYLRLKLGLPDNAPHLIRI